MKIKGFRNSDDYLIQSRLSRRYISFFLKESDSGMCVKNHSCGVKIHSDVEVTMTQGALLLIKPALCSNNAINVLTAHKISVYTKSKPSLFWPPCLYKYISWWERSRQFSQHKKCDILWFQTQLGIRMRSDCSNHRDVPISAHTIKRIRREVLKSTLLSVLYTTLAPLPAYLFTSLPDGGITRPASGALKPP